MRAAGHVFVLASCLLFAACDDDPGTTPDAKTADAAIDGNGSGCAGIMLSAELVDIDSSNASFKGVPGAMLTVDGSSATLTTPPNGRIELCVPDSDPIRLAIAAPSTYLDSAVYIEKEAATDQSAAGISFRTFTAERAATFYTERGVTYDAAKAQLLVYSTLDRSDLAIDRAHDTAQAGNDDDGDGAFTWAAGKAGRFVLFPNVDPGAATTKLSGDPQSAHDLPIAAGTLTIAVVHYAFL